MNEVDLFNQLVTKRGMYSKISSTKVSLVHRLFNDNYFKFIKYCKWNCVLLSDKDLFDYYQFIGHEKDKLYTPYSYYLWLFTNKKPEKGLLIISGFVVSLTIILK